MASHRYRIAVLGSGIMGSSAAIFLARKGVTVDMFDASEHPFAAASRWNEGKIHLGYLYSGDPSLKTAHRLIRGGLSFKPLVEELIGCNLDSSTTFEDDLFLCHRNSVVSVDAMARYFDEVTQTLQRYQHIGRYLNRHGKWRFRKIAGNELSRRASPDEIVAGFVVPERSVLTNWVADRYVDALRATNNIELWLGTRVTAAMPEEPDLIHGNWYVDTSRGRFGPFDYVINALWEGKLAIDHSAGLALPKSWSNRYRLALFTRTRTPVSTASFVIATGPFGDVKNYNYRDFYLSWYPKGLIVNSSSLSPPAPPVLEGAAERQLTDSILDSLSNLVPDVKKIRDDAETTRLGGGWVFASGQGELDDPMSTLHSRSAFGLARRGRYLSVDTGKYSTAPWMAKELADSLLQ